MEPLEPREVPAVNIWRGYTSNFTDPNNWSNGLPAADDALYFQGNASSTGTTFYQGDKTYPSAPGGGAGGGGVDGEGPPPGGGSGTWTYTFPDHYVGIYIQQGYGGTIQFLASTSFAYYWQDTGTTANTTGGLTTTVTSQFYWAGGTINAGTVGNFDLAPGANGLIDPGDGNTVTLGSTMTLHGGTNGSFGATLTHESGTWNLNQGHGVTVEGWASLNLISGETSDPTSPPPPGPPSPEMKHLSAGVNVVDGVLKVKKDAMLGYYPNPNNYYRYKRYSYTEDLSILIDDGTIYVKSNTNANVTGNMTVAQGGGGQLNVSIHQTSEVSGKTQLEAGSSFTVTTRILVSGGRFEVTTMPGVTQATTPAAIIRGTLYLGGGVLTMPGTTLYNTLNIMGDFDWSGGEVHLAIGKPSAQPINDAIIVRDNMTIANTPNLQIRWSSVVPTLTDTTAWELITVNGTLAGTATLTADILNYQNDPLFQKFVLDHIAGRVTLTKNN